MKQADSTILSIAEGCGCKAYGSGIKFCPLHAAAEEMLAALKDVIDMLNSGLLVRDVTNDANPTWGINMMKFVVRLNRITAAIAKAEGK